MNLADRLKQTTLRDLTRGGYKEQVRGWPSVFRQEVLLQASGDIVTAPTPSNRAAPTALPKP